MTDNAFELEMFDTAYRNAVEANNVGNIPAAKAYFRQAAQIMERLAENGDPALKSKRKERAEKLKFIADNLQIGVSADRSDTLEKSGASGGTPKFLNISKPDDDITFDDIIGLDGAKAAIHRLLIDPLNNPAAYKKYGLKAGGFILLEGPPGTGKTTFAKAAAHELGVPFADINANALVDSYIGKTGKNIDTLFAEARALAKQKNSPVVLFMDELDFLAQKRGGENKTAAEAVPALIKQMDGFSTNSDDLVLIAATNIKDSLDAAVLSRFRNVINIPLPTTDDRKRMFAAKLKRVDEADMSRLDLDRAAEQSAGLSGRDISQISLDFMSALAARDAGLKPIDTPLAELLSALISNRASNK